jgi:hypothetical protein
VFAKIGAPSAVDRDLVTRAGVHSLGLSFGLRLRPPCCQRRPSSFAFAATSNGVPDLHRNVTARPAARPLASPHLESVICTSRSAGSL